MLVKGRRGCEFRLIRRNGFDIQRDVEQSRKYQRKISIVNTFHIVWHITQMNDMRADI